jgi:hypothetical protein
MSSSDSVLFGFRTACETTIAQVIEVSIASWVCFLSAAYALLRQHLRQKRKSVSESLARRHIEAQTSVTAAAIGQPSPVFPQ